MSAVFNFQGDFEYVIFIALQWVLLDETTDLPKIDLRRKLKSNHLDS